MESMSEDDAGLSEAVCEDLIYGFAQLVRYSHGGGGSWGLGTVRFASQQCECARLFDSGVWVQTRTAINYSLSRLRIILGGKHAHTLHSCACLWCVRLLSWSNLPPCAHMVMA